MTPQDIVACVERMQNHAALLRLYTDPTLWCAPPLDVPLEARLHARAAFHEAGRLLALAEQVCAAEQWATDAGERAVDFAQRADAAEAEVARLAGVVENAKLATDQSRRDLSAMRRELFRAVHSDPDCELRRGVGAVCTCESIMQVRSDLRDEKEERMAAEAEAVELKNDYERMQAELARLIAATTESEMPQTTESALQAVANLVSNEAHYRQRADTAEAEVARLLAEIKTHVAAVLHLNDKLMQAETALAAERAKRIEVERERDAAKAQAREWGVNWSDAARQLDASKDRRCGTCADWDEADDGPTHECISPTSACNNSSHRICWPATHGCPHWRPKDGAQ